MGIAFVVMQIGDSKLDHLFQTAIQPAIESVGLQAKRADRDTQGGLLKGEIIQFLSDAEIIIADLTNERPNVYLEVGYAMGIDKYRNLILTCRRDHLPENPGWQADGPKVHFDLAGYNILLWNPSDPDSFCQELKRHIRRRLAILSPVAQDEKPVLDVEWLRTHREIASQRMEDARITTYMEASFGIFNPKTNRSPSELLSAAKNSMIQTFGWPIGVVASDKFEYQPQPRSDGIVAELNLTSTPPRFSYDYWALRRNGDYFLRKSLFEDKRDKTAIFFTTRIMRNTELLLYALRLYDRLGIDPSTGFILELCYGGLSGRVLRTPDARRYLSRPYKCTEDQIMTSYTGSLQDIEGSLTEVVKDLTSPMFGLFEFFDLPPSVYQEIVEAFVNGQVT